MQWNLRIRAAERGIWKSAQMRRMLAEAGLEISAGKMSSWWAGTPATMKLEELDMLCSVLECTPTDLMSPEPDKVAARRPRATETVNGDSQGHAAGKGGISPTVTPRFGKPRSEPPL
ncbi:helix-turn-helix transcriptional regulator [Arthrobacter sp. NPDC089319]|uniref:helix-turn-helix domain-containing protein n=1 Tax=Arthrobacter sp. NPDC089319 TaxID=3155915 RepID=UPI003423BA45